MGIKWQMKACGVTFLIQYFIHPLNWPRSIEHVSLYPEKLIPSSFPTSYPVKRFICFARNKNEEEKKEL